MATITKTNKRKERRVLNRLADEWYGERFDDLSLEHKDEVYCYACDIGLIEWEV